MSRPVALICPICGAQLERERDICGSCGAVVFRKHDTPGGAISKLNQERAQEYSEGFRQRLRHDYLDAEAHYGLGVVHYNLGRFDDAANELALAAGMMPDNADLYFQLAIVYRELMRGGDESASAKSCQSLATTLRLDPKNPSALSLKAKLLVDQGDFDGAVDVIERLAALDSAAAEEVKKRLRAIRSRYNLDRGQWDRAHAILDRMDSESRKTTLVDFLSAHEPTVLYPAKEVKHRSVERRNRNVAVIAIGVVVLMTFTGWSAETVAIAVVIGMVVPFLVLTQRIEANRRSRRIVVDTETINAAKSSSHELAVLAYWVSMRLVGKAITEDEFLAAESEKRKAR